MVAKGFKNTEIGVIPEEWEVQTVGDIIDFSGGSQPPLSTFSNVKKDGFVRLIQIRDYKSDKFKVYIDERLGRKFCKKDDIMIGRYGPPIFQILRGIEGAYNVALLKATPTNVILKDYAWHFLRNERLFNFIDKLSQRSSGQTGVDLGELRSYLIPLPPLPEQKAIAEALSDADAWIANLDQLIAKTRLIKQGAMQQLLSPKEDWGVKKLGEIAKVVGGGTPSTFNPEYWNGDIEWFTPTEVGYTKYLRSSRRKISKAGLFNSSASILPVGTLLLTSRAGIGDIGILTTEASTNQGFQSLIVNSEIDNEFIYYLMLTKRALLLQNASGSTFLEISPNKVKSIDLAIPSLAEQTRIATILSDMDTEIESLENQLAKARQIKQGMMQALLTGRVRLVKS